VGFPSLVYNLDCHWSFFFSNVVRPQYCNLALEFLLNTVVLIFFCCACYVLPAAPSICLFCFCFYDEIYCDINFWLTAFFFSLCVLSGCFCIWCLLGRVFSQVFANSPSWFVWCVYFRVVIIVWFYGMLLVRAAPPSFAFFDLMRLVPKVFTVRVSVWRSMLDLVY